MWGIIAAWVGLVVGVVLVTEGLFQWLHRIGASVGTERPASKTEIRVSEVIIGAIFIVLAILVLAGVI